MTGATIGFRLKSTRILLVYSTVTFFMNILVIAKLSHGNVLWYFSFSLHTGSKLHWKHEPDPPYSFISEDCIHSWDPPKICWHKWVCALEKSQRVQEVSVFILLLVAKETDQRWPHSRIQVMDGVYETERSDLHLNSGYCARDKEECLVFPRMWDVSTSQHTEQSPQQLNHCTCMCECEMRQP